MKKIRFLALLVMILFCIDYSVTELLGFHLLYARITEMDFWAQCYAFVIGISGFYSILALENDQS